MRPMHRKMQRHHLNLKNTKGTEHAVHELYGHKMWKPHANTHAPVRQPHSAGLVALSSTDELEKCTKDSRVWGKSKERNCRPCKKSVAGLGCSTTSVHTTRLCSLVLDKALCACEAFSQHMLVKRHARGTMFECVHSV